MTRRRAPRRRSRPPWWIVAAQLAALCLALAVAVYLMLTALGGRLGAYTPANDRPLGAGAPERRAGGPRDGARMATVRCASETPRAPRRVARS